MRFRYSKIYTIYKNIFINIYINIFINIYKNIYKNIFINILSLWNSDIQKYIHNKVAYEIMICTHHKKPRCAFSLMIVLLCNQPARVTRLISTSLRLHFLTSWSVQRRYAWHNGLNWSCHARLWCRNWPTNEWLGKSGLLKN